MQRFTRFPLMALVLVTSLLLACAPAAAPSPTTALPDASKAKPTDAPKAAEKPTEALKPAAPPVPAAAPAKPAASRKGWPTQISFGLIPTENSADVAPRPATTTCGHARRRPALDGGPTRCYAEAVPGAVLPGPLLSDTIRPIAR